MTASQPTVEPKLNALNPGRAGALKGSKCAICQLPLKVRESIDELFVRNSTAISVVRTARKLFKADVAAIQEHTFYHHRAKHVRALARATAKLSDGQRMVHQRVKLARAVLRDEVDPQAYFGPAALAQDIQKTSNRLDLAADEAYQDGEHASLASLSGQLLRAVELRGKLGGSLREAGEVNVNIGLGELHQRLDGLLGASVDERQHAARQLLGLAPPASTSSPPINESFGTSSADEPMTIDIEANEPELEPVPMSPIDPPPALATAKAADEAADDAAWPSQPAPFFDGASVRQPDQASAANRPMSRRVDEIRSFDEPSASTDAAWRR